MKTTYFKGDIHGERREKTSLAAFDVHFLIDLYRNCISL